MRGFGRLIAEIVPLVGGKLFPAGTRCYFDQDEPPTGWVRDTTSTLDDRCVKIAVGALADGGSWTISGLTGSSHLHPYTKHLAHTHSASGSSHSHTFSVSQIVNTTYRPYTDIRSLAGNVPTSSVAPSLTVGSEGLSSGNTSSNGVVISSDGAWRPKYRDLIVAYAE